MTLQTKPTQIPTLQLRKFTVAIQNNNSVLGMRIFHQKLNLSRQEYCLSQGKYLLHRKNFMPLKALNLISLLLLIMLLGSRGV